MRSLSLRTQILFLVLALVSIALGSLIIITISQVKKQLNTSIEHKAISICTIVAESIGPGLEFQDSSYISDYVGGVFADEDVAGICICDDNKKSIYREIRNNLDKYIYHLCPASDTIQISHFENYCSISTAVYSQGRIVGNIWLVLSTESVTQRIKSSIQVILLITSLILTLIVLAGSYITRKIVRPIAIFEEASEKISKGDMLDAIEITSLGKDFRPLGVAFNEMRTELDSAFEKLQESKIILEEQVHERTKDLKKELVDRMLAEEALRDSKQRLTLHVEQTPLGVIEWNLNFEVVEWNKAAEKIFGYTKDEASGRHPVGLIIPESGEVKEHVDKIWQSLVENKGGYRSTNENTTKNGETILCEWYNTPLISQDGKVIGVASLVKDITERAKFEKALEESESRYRAVSEVTSDYTYEYRVEPDGELKIEWISGSLTQITGYTPDEIIANGGFTNTLVIPEDIKILNERVDRLLKNKPDTSEIRIVTKEGRIRVLRQIGRPIWDETQGRVIGIIGAAQDITEHKRAENALRESESKYRTLYDKAYDAIFLLQGAKFIDCNAKALEMFDCTREQIIGQSPVSFSSEFQPDGRRSSEKAYEKIQAALAGEAQIFEWVHCKYDRTPFPADVNLNSMELDGETYILAFVRDITERKNAEEQEDNLKDKLERAQRMESLGILAGGIAHDLNNMLGPLVGYPELMLLKLPEDSPLRSQITRIGSAAQRASDVVQDLLTLARRGRYTMEPTDVNDIIETYLDSPGFSKLVDTHPDIDLSLDLAKPLANITGSSPHLSKVFMNLIVNAFDAMPEGGTLTIKTSQMYLEKLTGGHDKIENGDYVVTRISDTGMGIDPKDLDKIFEPYYSRKKMGSSGSGLGLSVVYGVVKDHKGYYDVISAVGEGTEFVLYFPVSHTELKQQSISEFRKGGNERILVVDDAPDQREMAAEILSSFGYRIETAVNGSDAVNYLQNHSVDLVVLDMIMENNFDGLDTYREIIKIHPNQKAIIVSGFSATDRVQQMLELGAGQYVKKPYTMDAIGKAIREELDRELVNQ